MTERIIRGRPLPVVPGLLWEAAVPLETATDLNNFHLAGLWDVTNPINAPAAGAYYLQVWTPSAAVRPAGVHQTVVDQSSGVQYTRIFTLLEPDVLGWTDWTEVGGGVTDHGALSGLSDDDHPQYLTEARADALYAPIGGGGGDAAPYVVLTALATGLVEDQVTQVDFVWDSGSIPSGSVVDGEFVVPAEGLWLISLRTYNGAAPFGEAYLGGGATGDSINTLLLASGVPSGTLIPDLAYATAIRPLLADYGITHLGAAFFRPTGGEPDLDLRVTMSLVAAF